MEDGGGSEEKADQVVKGRDGGRTREAGAEEAVSTTQREGGRVTPLSQNLLSLPGGAC